MSSTITNTTVLSRKLAQKGQSQVAIDGFIATQLVEVWFDARLGVHLVRKGEQIVPDKGYLKGLEHSLRAWVTSPKKIKEAISQLDAQIKRERSIQLFGPIAGRKTGDIVKCNGIEWLVTSSPILLEPKAGSWPHLRILVESLLLDEASRLAMYSWLKIQMKAIMSGNHSKCPMLILTGDADDGKSFFLRLITILRGGREINPMKAWNGEGPVWTNHLICAECLNIDDSAAQRDYRSRENLAAKFKEAIYADSVTIDQRHTTSFTLNPRPVWGVVMALNANGNAIKVVPALDGDDMKDKAVVLRTHRAEILDREKGDEVATQRMQTYQSELPAFLDWLLNVFAIPETLPEGCVRVRSGAVLYRDPEAMKMLHRASPSGLLEEALLELKEEHPKESLYTPITSQTFLNLFKDGYGKIRDSRVPQNAQLMGIYLKQVADRSDGCVVCTGEDRNGSKLWCYRESFNPVP